MGFNNKGPLVSLNPGQSVYWSYWFGGAEFGPGGDDYGSQIATANVNGGDPWNTPLLADGQMKSQYYEAETATPGPQGVTYYVTITNNGSSALSHNLQGGGLT
ncbi:MAG: hypothetical protein ACLQOZ_09260 [Acidimicrobiales bacterium]